MTKSFYLNNLFYYVAGSAAVVFVLSYFFPAWYRIGTAILLLLMMTVILDAILVYSKKKGIQADRVVTERFSIGDLNKVVLHLVNDYSFPVRISVIDELPMQFQERKWLRKLKLERAAGHDLEYFLQPLERGEYIFNDINVYVQGPLQLVKRRFVFPARQVVKVYPSYMQMRRFQLLAVSNKLQEAGVKQIR